MSLPGDPGWRPALPVALRIVGWRRPSGSILIVLRATAMFLGAAAAVTAVLGVILSAGADEPRVAEVTARLVLGAAVGAAVLVAAVTGRESPDLRSPGHLAVWLFGVTIRRLLAAAAVGPVGFLLSWMAGSAAYVVVGAGAAMLLIAVVAPTADRLRTWQSDITEAGSDIVVLEALGMPYR